MNNRQAKEIDHLQDELNEQTNKLKEILHRREELEEEVHNLKDTVASTKKEANISRKETQLILSDLETKNREVEVRKVDTTVCHNCFILGSANGNQNFEKQSSGRKRKQYNAG